MAVTLSISEVRQTGGGSGLEDANAYPDARVTEMIESASALIAEAAPGAPDAVSNAAARRVIRWLAQQGVEIDGSSLLASSGGAAGPMRSSGADSMLARFRKHRARGVARA